MNRTAATYLVIVALLALGAYGLFAWLSNDTVHKDDVAEVVAPVAKAEVIKALKDVPELKKALVPTAADLAPIVAQVLKTDPSVKALITPKGQLDEDAIVALIKRTVVKDPAIAAFIKGKASSSTAPIDEEHLRVLVLELLLCDDDVAWVFETNRVDEDDLLQRLKLELLADTTFVVEVCCAGLYCLPGCYLPPDPQVVEPTPAPVVKPAPARTSPYVVVNRDVRTTANGGAKVTVTAPVTTTVNFGR